MAEGAVFKSPPTHHNRQLGENHPWAAGCQPSTRQVLAFFRVRLEWPLVKASNFAVFFPGGLFLAVEVITVLDFTELVAVTC